MTAETNFPSHKIDNRKWGVEEREKEKRQRVKLEQVNGPRVGEKTQERCGFRFVKQKPVILAGEEINREGDDEIKFSPQKRADNCDGARPKTVNEHEKNDSDNDSAVRDEETDEAQIRKTESQIRRNDGLKRSADSPKVGDFEPAPVSRPKRADDDDHRPIAQLKRQHFIPVIHAELAGDDDISCVIY